MDKNYITKEQADALWDSVCELCRLAGIPIKPKGVK